MKTLGTELKYQGRTRKQLKREGRVALYAVFGRQEMLYGYELIIIKILPEEEIFGKRYPEREAYPSGAKESLDWGSIAWSYPCTGRLKALAGFNHLCRKQQEGDLEVSNLEIAEG